MFAASFWADYPAAVQSVAYFLLSGGFFMLLIVLCSILALTVVVWKAFELRRQRIVPEPLATEIENAHADALGNLAATTGTGHSVLARLSHAAITDRFSSKDEGKETVQAHARQEVVHMEAGIAALEVVITIAPLLGLLGTVKGLVGVFSALGTGAGGALGADPTLLALGISEALNTTIAGLAVAVPTVIAHSYFSKKVEKLAVRMEILVGKLLALRFSAPING